MIEPVRSPLKIDVKGLNRPIRNPSFNKLFLGSIPLVAGILLAFMIPGRLKASDFMLIAWGPGQELIKTGIVNANYPYPIWTVLVMLPFTIWPLQTAMSLWFACNLLMLAASLAILIPLLGLEISLLMFGVLVIFSGFFLPVLTSIWLGQLSILSLLILALTTSLFLNRRWTWLGIVLGFSFIKPQVMILLAILILLWALWHRRWQTLLGFSGVMLLFTLISLPFISSPAQIIGGGIGSHLTEYIMRTSTIWGFLMSIGLPWFIPLIISIGLLAWMGISWWSKIREKELGGDQVLFLFSATILVNLITVPYSWMHNLVLLLLPVGYSLALAYRLKRRDRIGWLILLFFIMHPLMLALFVAFNGPTHTQAYQVIPALLIIPVLWYLDKQITVPQTR